MTSYGSSGSNTCGIFTGTTVDDCVDGDLKGVLVGEEVDDVESMFDDSDGQELLTVVSSVHHEGVGQSLDDGALGFAESLGGVSAGSVWEIDCMTKLDVVAVC